MLKSSFSNQYLEAGLDEVGRGCLAGPVVAAAVILPSDFQHSILTDSKKLTSKQRIQLETEIKSQAISWAIAEASPTEIDQINIAQASMLAMHRALAKLSLRPELLLVDGNRFTPFEFIPFQCVIKGDGIYYSIAAASVIAKVYRDELMTKLASEHPQYEWQQNMGYPTKAHRRALEQFGDTAWHRKSFKWKKVINDSVK
jgi:ribonuclease HII